MMGEVGIRKNRFAIADLFYSFSPIPVLQIFSRHSSNLQ